MKRFKRLLHYLIHEPSVIVAYCFERLFSFLNDESYLKCLYWIKFKKKLNLESPSTFNEKLQWLKLYDRKPIYKTMVDKYQVKQHVSNLIGDEYIIPTLGVWERFEDIDFDALPKQFVLKTTHGGGGYGVYICKDKTTFNRDECRRRLNKSMKQNIYKQLREWPYKDIKPRIIAEEYITNGGSFINDYKFFCFDGEPKIMLIASGRYIEPETCFDYFDMDFNHLPFEQGGPNYNKPIAKPQLFEEMKAIAAKLSAGIPHARIDLYEVDGRVMFGEITFFDSSGFAKFKPDTWAYKMGGMITLPNK
mgnify:FL=1